jgi:hypothetical protein
MSKRFLISVLTLVLWTPISASAGTKIINLDPGDSPLNNLYIQDDMLATLDDQGKTKFIYDNKRQTMTILQHSDKRYMQVDQQSLAAMVGGLSKMRKQAMKMMEQQMAGLSDEQRQQMEKMMGNMMPAPPEEQTAPEFVQTSRSDKVNGVNCRWLEIRQGGKKTSEACVAKLSDTKLNEKDYQTLQGFFKVIEKVVSEFGELEQDMQLNNLMFDKNRVPLKLKDYKHSSGKEVSLEFIPGSFDVSLFTVPKGYQLQSMPKMSMPEN